MILLLEVLAVLAVVFGVAVVLTGRSEGMSDEPRDLADTGIPRDRPMTPQDVVGLRFALAFRGYRMAEVDDALDRLAAEVAARDEALARLHAGAAEPAGEAYVPSDATGELPYGPRVEVPPAPDAGEPDGYEPRFEEPVAEPVAEPAAEPVAEAPPWTALEAPSPYRPEVPDIPAYDPWSVTPKSRYTEGPTYVEVDHDDDGAHVDALTEHHTGYAPPAPETAPETAPMPVAEPDAAPADDAHEDTARAEDTAAADEPPPTWPS
jgi:DivIVA domain-containing protein